MQQWTLEVDSLGDLSKMIIPPSQRKASCSTALLSRNRKIERLLDEISKEQLAKMLMILKVNREWFAVLQSLKCQSPFELYSDILLICLLKVNQHQFDKIGIGFISLKWTSFTGRKKHLKKSYFYRASYLSRINFDIFWQCIKLDMDIGSIIDPTSIQ